MLAVGGICEVSSKCPPVLAGLSAANYCSGERWYVMLNHSLSWGRSLHSPGGGGGGEGGRREGGGREEGGKMGGGKGMKN